MTPDFPSIAGIASAPASASAATDTSTATSTPSAPEAPALPPHTVTLDTPIQRGSQLVKHVTLRRPLAGELRGIALASLLQLDVASLQALLPRITAPMLTRAEIDQLDPADLVQIGSEAINFFLQKKDRESLDA